MLELFFNWVRSGFDVNLPPKAGLQTAVLSKEVSYPLGVLGFRDPDLPGDRGLQQCRQPDGRPGRPGHHARGRDGRVHRWACLPTWWATRCIPNTCSSRTFRARGELLIFCSAMAGAGLAFLWFNTHPAQVFMGMWARWPGRCPGHHRAVIVRQEIVLAIMGGIFVVEGAVRDAAGELVQVHQKRYGEGRRLLKMAPLHHHFEKAVEETQVVVRFWIITMLLCLVGHPP